MTVTMKPAVDPLLRLLQMRDAGSLVLAAVLSSLAARPWRGSVPALRSVAGPSGRRGLAGDIESSALGTHVSYPRGGGSTAVIEAATLEDMHAVVLFAARTACPGPRKDSRVWRIREQAMLDMAYTLHDRSRVLHVLRIDGVIRGAQRLRPMGHRIIADAPLLSPAALAFDPGIAQRFAEHAAHCCRLEGWPLLVYEGAFADLAEAEAFAAALRGQGISASAGPGRGSVIERLGLRRPRLAVRAVFPSVQSAPQRPA